jgi:thymidine phosphorylase
VGFTFHKKIGDAVKKDEAILSIHHHPHQKEIVAELVARFQKEVIALSATKVRPKKLIIQKLH